MARGHSGTLYATFSYMPLHVLLLEPHPVHEDFVKVGLQSEGYQVECIPTLERLCGRLQVAPHARAVIAAFRDIGPVPSAQRLASTANLNDIHVIVTMPFPDPGVEEGLERVGVSVVRDRWNLADLSRAIEACCRRTAETEP